MKINMAKIPLDDDSQNRIPKIIHYVWLGKGEKPPIIEKCIESWRKFCPDFEIKEWNEDCFDIDSHPFVKEAIKCKKWAFAADYIRIYALKTFGGIYLDTDMELLRDINPFLCHEAFFGYENAWIVGSAIIGCTKNHPVMNEMLSYYENRHFIKRNGKMDQMANTFILTSLIRNKFKKQVKEKSIVIYAPEVFYPKDIYIHFGQT